MKMKITQYKNPIYDMYVAPYGHHFVKDGQNIGRIIWTNKADGITIEKDNNI